MNRHPVELSSYPMTDHPTPYDHQHDRRRYLQRELDSARRQLYEAERRVRDLERDLRDAGGRP